VPVDSAGTINGGRWLDHFHLLLWLTIHTDASSRRWGGRVVLEDKRIIEAAGDFTREQAARHINWKELYAVLEVLRALVQAVPGCLYGRRIRLFIDNKTALGVIRRGGSVSPELTALAQELFWFQVRYEFSINLEWVNTKDNVHADALTREDAAHDVRLDTTVFRRLAARAGGIDVDWCASAANAQSITNDVRLPFVSMYEMAQAVAVDVLAQDMSTWPQRGVSSVRARGDDRVMGYCYPPRAILGAVVAVAHASGARVLLIVTGWSGAWLPTLCAAMVWREQLAVGGTQSDVLSWL
jgi:hypothetical protein